MNVDNVNNNTNLQFGAIFKFTKVAGSVGELVEDALKSSTVAAEAEKIERKFAVGGGSLYVYIPDENMEKLLKNLRCLNRDAYTELLTRVD